jgi:hypothetical protein
MSSTSPDFDYWKKFTALRIWEIAVLMHGFDPRAVSEVLVKGGHPCDANGKPLDYSDETRKLKSAVKMSELRALESNSLQPCDDTEVTVESLVPWLWGFDDYRELAKSLSNSVHSSVLARTKVKTQSIESTEERQDRRLAACEEAGLTFLTNPHARMPNGIGAIANAEDISRQAFTQDVKAAIARRVSHRKNGLFPN